MKGIVIGTSLYTKDFLKHCLESIKHAHYPILVVSNDSYNPEEIVHEVFQNTSRAKEDIKIIINDWNGWEPAVIQRGKETFDEFVHLMDTTVVKNIELFDKLFALEGNVVLTKGNFHYMGKFVTSFLPNMPKVFTKDVAIMMEVRWLPKPYTEFEPDLPVHTNNFETIHGQYRMVLENEYIKKWKGTWIESPEHPIPK